MKRATGLVLLGWLVMSCGALAGQPANERPNFIVFIADDMSWDDCGAYGHPTIRTPNIDRLAREGMRFDRAFLTTSSCSPSRASILTGRYPHATGAPELHQPIPADQVLVTTPLRQAGYFTALAGKSHLGPHVLKQFDLVLDRPPGPSGTEQWLEVLRGRPKDKPFFLWLAAIDPHRPYNQGSERRHDPVDVRVPPYLPDVPEVRQDFARYYDEISRMDDAIGAVLAELEAQGVASNTFVLFMSDNGRPFPRAKTTLYADGIRTPFIVRLADRVKAGSATQSIVSAVDIAPTILELAGATAPDTLQGKSFAPVLNDPTATIREYAFAQQHWHDYRAYQRAVRSARFTYIRNWLPELAASPPADVVRSPTFQTMRDLYAKDHLTSAQAGIFESPRPSEELYDLQDDPHALHNLVESPAHSAALAKHREQLDTWREQTADAFPADRLTPDRFDRRTGEPLR